MKNVMIDKSGMYYDPETFVTQYLEKKAYSLNDRFAKLIIDEEGGHYCDAKDVESGAPVVVDAPEEKEPVVTVDYSKYDLTSGALKLAEEKELTTEFLDTLTGTGHNGRITKDDLEDAIVEDFEGEG